MNTTSHPNSCSLPSAVMVCSMCDAYFCFFQSVLISAVKDKTGLGPLGDFHFVRRKKASKHTRQSAAGAAYVVGGYRDDDWDPENPRPSMPFVPLAALLFLLGDVFDGYRQQDDPASVPLLTPHAGGGIDPSPLWVVHGRPTFYMACAAVPGRNEWAIVLVLPAGPVPDADEC